jgi:hypothetical protein
VITGFGITEFRTIEPLTLGLLTKPLSFQIHSALAYPFVVLLAVHIYLVLTVKHKWETGNKSKDRKAGLKVIYPACP